jgi:hypothetical protein
LQNTFCRLSVCQNVHELKGLCRVATSSLEAQIGYGCSHWKTNLEGSDFDGSDIGYVLQKSSNIKKKRPVDLIIKTIKCIYFLELKNIYYIPRIDV